MTLSRGSPQTKSIVRMIRRRLQNLGVAHPIARNISQRVRYQLDHQGELGTVRYLKACGDKLQSYLHGDTSLRKEENPIWVATRAKFPVFFEGLEDMSEGVLSRVSKLARAIRTSTTYQDQVDKVTQAVVTPYGGTSFGLARMSTLIRAGASSLGMKDLGSDMSIYDQRIPLITKKFSKVTSTSCDMAKAYSNDSTEFLEHTIQLSEPPILESLQVLADHPDLQVGNWTKSFFPLKDQWVRDIVHDLTRPVEQRTPYVGEIYFTIEGALKIRMFAAPYSVVACILYPLHYMLADLRKYFISTDVTNDQPSGAERIQSWLNGGDTVYSVDLSTATCRFPLEPQIEYLRFLGVPDEWISALVYVCTGHWHCGVEAATAFALPSLQWEVGQPLGIPPSMSMFGSCHNLLLRGLALELGLDPDQSFVVLGDDVGIRYSQLAERYMALLEECAIPVSWTKTHASSRYAEFAGFMISRKEKTRPGQWRIAGYTNMLEIAENIGAPLKGEVSYFHQEIQKLHLFRQGLYDPAPQEYPDYVRLSTEFSLCFLERWTTYKAPYWHFKVQDVMCSQIRALRPFGTPGAQYQFDPSVWPFHEEWKSMSEILYEFLHRVASDKDREVADPEGTLANIVSLMWYDAQCNTGLALYPNVRMIEGFRSQSMVSSYDPDSDSFIYEQEPFGLKPPSEIMWDAYTTLNTLWWTGAFSELEYHTLTLELCEHARSLLYMPQKAHTQNKLIALAKRMGEFLRNKEKYLNPGTYTSVRSGYYRFS